GTGLCRYAQVAGIEEAHKLNTLSVKQTSGAFRNTKLSLAHPLARKPRSHMGVFLSRRGGIAAMTCGACQTKRVLAVIELVECRGWAKAVHRLDLVMTLETSFEWRRGGSHLFRTG